jgi:hypothetical protein
MTDPTPPGLRRNDPDETHGRLLYRQLADREARQSIGLSRRATLGRLVAALITASETGGEDG